MQAGGKTAKYNILKERNWKGEPLWSRTYGNGKTPTKRRNMGSAVTLRQSKYKGTWTESFLSTPLSATSIFSVVRYTAQRGQQSRYGLDDFRVKILAGARKFSLLEIVWTGSGALAPGQLVQWFCQEDKAFGTCSWPLASSSVERKNESSCAASWGGRGKFYFFIIFKIVLKKIFL